MGEYTTPRDQLITRWGDLKSERASWMGHYKEISDYLLPRSGRFFVQDRNQGNRRHNNIIDNTGSAALRVLSAGMMAGMTSPARPWFRLSTGDADLAKSSNVKIWLDDVQKLMLEVFAAGNTYRTLHGLYQELGAFGTAATIFLPNRKNVVHHYPLTAGEYCIAQDAMGEVTAIYREFQLPVHAIVGEFGREKCSLTVRNLYDWGKLDAWVTIMHAIEPRADRDPRKRDAINMEWKSCYFELNADRGMYLRESGFKNFPAMCPRWATTGGDIYGESPAMEALGDVKALQHLHIRKAQVIDKQTNPALQVPSGLKSRDVNMLPGGITFVDMTGQNNSIRTLYEVRTDLSHLLEDVRDTRNRVNMTFYRDMFLLISSQDASGDKMTAAEVWERKEEKFTMIGPVVERLQNELLDPLVENTFTRMLEAGIIPPPPEELQGADLQVEFVSMMAQAQKAVGTNSIDRFVLNLGQIATLKPGILDKFDEDTWADIYSDQIGVNPRLVVSGEKVALIRQQKAQQAAAAQKMAMIQAGAGAAKDLASAQTSQPSALTNVMDSLSGYSTPGPQ